MGNNCSKIAFCSCCSQDSEDISLKKEPQEQAKNLEVFQEDLIRQKPQEQITTSEQIIMQEADQQGKEAKNDNQQLQIVNKPQNECSNFQETQTTSLQVELQQMNSNSEDNNQIEDNQQAKNFILSEQNQCIKKENEVQSPKQQDINKENLLLRQKSDEQQIPYEKFQSALTVDTKSYENQKENIVKKERVESIDSPIDTPELKIEVLPEKITLKEQISKIQKKQSLVSEEKEEITQIYKSLTNNEKIQEEKEIENINKEIKKLNQNRQQQEQENQNLEKINENQHENEKTNEKKVNTTTEKQEIQKQVQKEQAEKSANTEKPKQNTISPSQKEEQKINTKQLSKEELEQQEKRQRIYYNKVREVNMIYNRQDQQGDEMINQYKFLEELGKGTYAIVFKAQKQILKRLEYFAIKVFDKQKLKRMNRRIVRDKDGKRKQSSAIDEILTEIALMKAINHENLAKLHEVIDDDEMNRLYLVLEYLQKGVLIDWDDEQEQFYYCFNYFDFNSTLQGEELSETLQNKFLSEEQLRSIFCNCINGLFNLHDHNIVHRDIKPQNILFNQNGIAKIADFGQSILFDEPNQKAKTNIAGTAYFLAPELFKEDFDSEKASWKAIDIWALGVSFFAFTFLKLPFYAEYSDEFEEQLINQDLEFPTNREISQELKDFLSLFLEKDPARRVQLSELEGNKWINKDNGLKLITKDQSVKINDADIINAVIPIERIVLIKQCVNQLKKQVKKKKKK